MRKHVSGPWRVTRNPQLLGVPTRYQVQTERGEMICYLHVGKKPGGATEQATAQLIAAAPELLVVLKDVADATGCKGTEEQPCEGERRCGDCNRKAAALSAIARAEGSYQK